MEINKQKIIDKIIKLMEKSESAKDLGSIAEAETFASKAQSMLADYNLSKSDLTKEEAAAEILHEEMAAKVPGVGGRSSYNIMVVICKYNWCKAYTFGKTSENKMIIIGSPENIQVCKYIHSIVMRVFKEVGKDKYNDYKDQFEPYMNYKTGKPVGLDTFMRTFYVGAAEGLDFKLAEERRKFEQDNKSSTAIIITNGVVIKEYVLDKWGGTGKGRKTTIDNSTNARSAGREAGKNVKINKAMTGQSKPVTRKMLS